MLAKENDENVGILINRGLEASGYTMNGSKYNLRTQNIYLVGLISTAHAFGPSSGGSRTEAEVKSYATGLAVYLRETGNVAAIYSHGTTDTGANKITPQEWGWFIDAVKTVHPDMIKSFGQFAAIVRDSGTWTRNAVNNEVWNAVFTSQADYRLKPNSVLINTGTDLCSTLTNATDYAGKNICIGGSYVGRIAPEIGAYEYPSLGQSTSSNLNLLWVGK